MTICANRFKARSPSNEASRLIFAWRNSRPAPPKMRPRGIRKIRRSLNASQVLFARFLNISPNTVRSWEQGTRRPRGADLKLLSIAKRNPQALLSA